MTLAKRFIGAFESADRPQGEQREEWISMWADDAVWECPLTPQPLRLEGPEQVSTFMLWIVDGSRMPTAGQLLQYMSYPVILDHPSDDVEWHLPVGLWDGVGHLFDTMDNNKLG